MSEDITNIPAPDPNTLPILLSGNYTPPAAFPQEITKWLQITNALLNSYHHRLNKYDEDIKVLHGHSAGISGCQEKFTYAAEYRERTDKELAEAKKKIDDLMDFKNKMLGKMAAVAAIAALVIEVVFRLLLAK